MSIDSINGVNSVSFIQGSVNSNDFWGNDTSGFLGQLRSQIDAIKQSEDPAYQVTFGSLYSLLSIVNTLDPQNPTRIAAHNLFQAFKNMESGGSLSAVDQALTAFEQINPASQSYDMKAAMANILTKKMADEVRFNATHPAQKNLNHLQGYMDTLELIQGNAQSLGLPKFDASNVIAECKEFIQSPSAALSAQITQDLNDLNKVIQQ